MEVANRACLERLYRAVYTEADFKASSEAIDEILPRDIAVDDVKSVLETVLTSMEFKIIWYCYGFEDGEYHNIREAHERFGIKEPLVFSFHNVALGILRSRESLASLSTK